MKSHREFVIEGAKQAGRVFLVSLVVLVVVAIPSWLSIDKFNIDPSGSFMGLLLVFGWIAVALFGSVLAGPVPWILIHFDISDRQLVVLSCLFVIPYWILLGVMAGHGRWKFFLERSRQQPDPPSQKLSRQIRLLVEGFALAIAVFFFFAGPFIPSFGSGQRFPALVITNHLLQIDAAKNEFALEHKAEAGYIPTVADLSPYIRLADGRLPRYSLECYVINALSNPPYAFLTNDLWVPRRGWQEGHIVGTNGTIFRLPEQYRAK